MSRSYIHSPYSKICGSSDKLARTFANRKLRHRNKAIINRMAKGDEVEPKLLREVSNVYDFPSDGGATHWTDLNFNELASKVWSEVNFELNDPLGSRGFWTGYRPGELCEFFGRPFNEHTLRNFTNDEVKTYVNFVYRKAISR